MAEIGDELDEGTAMAKMLMAGLEEIQVDAVNWLVLYRHRQTRQYWEKSFPRAEMHGGGPWRLRCLRDGAQSWGR